MHWLQPLRKCKYTLHRSYDQESAKVPPDARIEVLYLEKHKFVAIRHADPGTAHGIFIIALQDIGPFIIFCLGLHKKQMGSLFQIRDPGIIRIDRDAGEQIQGALKHKYPKYRERRPVNIQ